MTAWGLAWRTVARNPARACLAIGGVAVIGALLFDMLLLSRGLLRLVPRSARHRRLRRARARDRGLAGPPRADRRRARRWRTRSRGCRRCSESRCVRTDTAHGDRAGPRGRRRRASRSSAARETRERRRVDDRQRIAAARRRRAPGEPAPLVVSTKLAAAAAARARIAAAPPRRARRRRVRAARGRLSRRRHRRLSRSRPQTTTPWRRRWRDSRRRTATPDGDDEADLVLVASAPGVGPEAAAAAIAALRPDLRVYSNEQVVEQFNAERVQLLPPDLGRAVVDHARVRVPAGRDAADDVGEPAARRGGGAARARLPAAADRGEPAVGIGAAGRRRRRSRRCRSAALLAVVLDRILREMPGVPERLHFFVFEPRTVVLHAALLGGDRRRSRRSIRSGWRRGCRSPRRCGARSSRDARADRRRPRPDARRSRCRPVPVTALGDVSIRDRARRVRRDHRAVGLRQIDAAAPARLRRHADRRIAAVRRARRRRAAASRSAAASA